VTVKEWLPDSEKVTATSGLVPPPPQGVKKSSSRAEVDLRVSESVDQSGAPWWWYGDQSQALVPRNVVD